MIAVIFEVVPAEGREGDYLAIAASLRTELERSDGFISVERFRSIAEPDKILSLSFFRDEAAVMAWRTKAAHRQAQAAGRSGVFAEYRLRVAHVDRDYAIADRAEAPFDSLLVHG